MNALRPMLAVVGLVFAQADSAESLGKLIEQLRSDSIEERSSASKRLAEFGDRAIPALEEAARSMDRSLQLSAQAILDDISRRSRIKAFQPNCSRVSLEFTDKPFVRALDAVTRPFGLSRPKFDADLANRTVSFKVKQGSLWETLSAFCEAVGCQLENLDPDRYRSDSENQLYIGEKPEMPFPYVQWLDHEEFRVILDSSSSERIGPKGWRRIFRVVIALPPGAWVEGADLEELHIRDDQDRPLRIEPPDDLAQSRFSCKRRTGIPTRVVAGNFSIIPSILNPSKHLTVQGKIKVHIPEDIEVIPSSPRPGMDGFDIPGAKIDIQWTPDGTLTCKASGRTGNDGLAFQIAAFEAGGAQLFDIGPYRVPPHVGFQYSMNEKAASRPEKLEAWKVTRTSTRVVPFKFSGVIFNSR